MQNVTGLGIVVSGGPAPGINSVIHAVVIEARKLGIRTFGFNSGFQAVCLKDLSAVRSIEIEQISRIHSSGGSIIGTSRFSPFAKLEYIQNLQDALQAHRINALVVIGGDGSAFLSYKLSKEFDKVQVIHIPKTIDNDLELPNHYPSFGFETARDAGTKIINTLMVDAATCGRWYIITTMGRKAGFLAIGLGLASGATLTMIPEEFEGRRTTITEISQLILKSVQYRLTQGKSHGVVILAEGLLDCIAPDTCPLIAASSRDELGRLRYADLELSDLVVAELRRLSSFNDQRAKFTSKNIGYELRCQEPISFDIEYTRMLGFGAVKFLQAGLTGVMVIIDHDKVSYLKLDEMLGQDGVIRSRKVDLASDWYQVANSFMLK